MLDTYSSTMSIDKFGRLFRSNGDGGGVAKGPPGEGFKLTPTGDYDMNFKILTNLADPKLAQDAVNLETLETWVRPCLKDVGDGTLDAKGKIIGNLGEPKELTDAVTIGTLGKYCVLYQDKSINVNDRSITRVRDPHGRRDAANKQYVDSVVPSKSANYWGFGKKRLVNVADPIDDTDVVTKKYLKLQCPVKGEAGYDFEDKRLMKVRDPTEAQDAATLHHCKNMETRLRGEISGVTSTTGTWVTSLETSIHNLRGAVNTLSASIDDNYLKTRQQLRKFSEQLFTYFHRQTGRSASENGDNYINWEEVFSTSVNN